MKYNEKFTNGIVNRDTNGVNRDTNKPIIHKNRINLDNRYENLRIITQKENSYNRTKNITSNNKYKGVIKRGNKYIATVTKDGKRHEIGGFETEEDAANAYDMMAQELFGEFAGLNFD